MKAKDKISHFNNIGNVASWTFTSSCNLIRSHFYDNVGPLIWETVGDGLENRLGPPAMAAIIQYELAISFESKREKEIKWTIASL